MQGRIFITGAGGFVGAALARADRSVVPLARGETPKGPGALIHLAWPDLPSSQTGPVSPRETFDRFVEASATLREVCRAEGVTFIGVGSGIEAYIEWDLADPYYTYARRKIALRQALVPDAWVRLHFLFGQGEAPHRLVPAAIRASLFGQPYACGALMRERHWLSIEDLALALLDFAADPVPEADLCGREAISFEDLLALVSRATGRPLDLVEPQSPAADRFVPLIAPQNLAPNLPTDAGVRANLLARLTEYAVLIGKAGPGSH